VKHRRAVLTGIFASLLILAAHDTLGFASIQPSILQADQALIQNLRQANRSAAGKLLHDDFSWIDRSGKHHSKSELLASPGAFTSDANLDAHDFGTIVYLSGSSQARSEKVRFVRVWVQDKSGWQAILQQDTKTFGKTASAQATVPVGTKCDNPCKNVPYDAPSPEAKAVVESWEGLEDAVNHRDADAWASHVADGFVFNVKEDGNPLTKADRVAIIRKQAQSTTVTDIGTVVPGTMVVHVFENAAVMTDRQQPTVGGNPYEALRIWIKRDGRWQLIYSQQTAVEDSR